MRLSEDRMMIKSEQGDYPVDFVANVGLFLWAVTGSNLCLQRAGTATCSGLVACALTRRGFVWSRPPFAMTPAGIATDLERFGCETT